MEQKENRRSQTGGNGEFLDREVQACTACPASCGGSGVTLHDHPGSQGGPQGVFLLGTRFGGHFDGPFCLGHLVRCSGSNSEGLCR